MKGKVFSILFAAMLVLSLVGVVVVLYLSTARELSRYEPMPLPEANCYKDINEQVE